jgi:hypothetical protein
MGVARREELLEVLLVSDFLFRWKREVLRRERGMRLGWLSIRMGRVNGTSLGPCCHQI